MNDDVLNLLISQPKPKFNTSINKNFDTSSISYQLNEKNKISFGSSILNLNELNLQQFTSNSDLNTFNSLDIEKKIKNLENQAKLLQTDKDVNLSLCNEKLYSNDSVVHNVSLTGNIFNSKPLIPQTLHSESLITKDNKLYSAQNKKKHDNYEVTLEPNQNVVLYDYLTNNEFQTNDFKMPNLLNLKWF
jgi:hypothetical protein